MPVDADGNRAEIIMDGDSTFKRMNLGRLYEQYILASGSKVSLTLREWFKNNPNPQQNDIEEKWLWLENFYRIVSPRHAEALIGAGVVNRKLDHLREVADKGVYIYTPTDNPASYPTVVSKLRKEYPACYGPIQYIGESGRLVTTKSNVLIGSMYFMLLEKIGNTWAAVASTRLQHHGIPARLTNADKYREPGRANPVRILGESETRLFTTTVGSETVADLFDQSTNPATHRHILNNIYHADKPSAIHSIVNRVEVPRGNGRILTYIRHVLECGGMRFVKSKESN